MPQAAVAAAGVAALAGRAPAQVERAAADREGHGEGDDGDLDAAHCAAPWEIGLKTSCAWALARSR